MEQQAANQTHRRDGPKRPGRARATEAQKPVANCQQHAGRNWQPDAGKELQATENRTLEGAGPVLEVRGRPETAGAQPAGASRTGSAGTRMQRNWWQEAAGSKWQAEGKSFEARSRIDTAGHSPAVAPDGTSGFWQRAG